MQKIHFIKMVASGNDFVVIKLPTPDSRLPNLSRRLCDRKYGVGADGLLVLEKSKIADIKMRIFNADGSEAEMCGNGARCAAFYSKLQTPNSQLKIETRAGVIKSKVSGNNIKIKLTDPKNIKLNISIKVNGRSIKVNFINTGVPHAVIFVEGLAKINVFDIGREIRYHHKFLPKGTNVDFVEFTGGNSIKVRTYERGVEDETLACGTGSVAAALVGSWELGVGSKGKINVLTKSGETLKVYFQRVGDKFSDVWLEGSAKIVYKGEYNV